VQMLRNAGATEVHVGVTSPPFRNPCYLGIDVAQKDQLIAAKLGTVENICKHIGADSLHYLSLDALIGATKLPAQQFCTGCLTGRYPVQIEDKDKVGEPALA
jgi:amidophosphoribosyltransferase